MKITKNITIDGREVIANYFQPEAKKQGVEEIMSKDIVVQVWSQTKGMFIDFEPKHVLFIWKTPEPEKPKAIEPKAEIPVKS